MTRYVKYLTCISVILCPLGVLSQNLYDLTHSRAFGLYLMQTRQYGLASQEWERVLFMAPDDTLARLNLVRSMRLSGHPGPALERMNQWMPDADLPPGFSREGIQSALMLRDFKTSADFLNRSPGLSMGERSDYELGAWLLEGQWLSVPVRKRVDLIVKPGTESALSGIYDRCLLIRRKSPAAAVGFSALLPGLGKVYAGDWKDGLMSLAFTGLNAWQSYRGFDKEGIKSVRGWIFGVIATGFYAANLFGSWKSAASYNSRQLEHIRNETDYILFGY